MAITLQRAYLFMVAFRDSFGLELFNSICKTQGSSSNQPTKPWNNFSQSVILRRRRRRPFTCTHDTTRHKFMQPSPSVLNGKEIKDDDDTELGAAEMYARVCSSSISHTTLNISYKKSL